MLSVFKTLVICIITVEKVETTDLFCAPLYVFLTESLCTKVMLLNKLYVDGDDEESLNWRYWDIELNIATIMNYTVSQKKNKTLTDFQNSFAYRLSGKFATNRMYISHHNLSMSLHKMVDCVIHPFMLNVCLQRCRNRQISNITSLKQSYLALANEPTATPVSPQSTLPVLRSLWLTI